MLTAENFPNKVFSMHVIGMWLRANKPEIKISTKKSEVLCLSRNPNQCMLQVGGNTLHKVERLKYHGTVFTSDGRQNEIDAQNGKVNSSS